MAGVNEFKFTFDNQQQTDISEKLIRAIDEFKKTQPTSVSVDTTALEHISANLMRSIENQYTILNQNLEKLINIIDVKLERKDYSSDPKEIAVLKRGLDNLENSINKLSKADLSKKVAIVDLETAPIGERSTKYGGKVDFITQVGILEGTLEDILKNATDKLKTHDIKIKLPKDITSEVEYKDIYERVREKEAKKGKIVKFNPVKFSELSGPNAKELNDAMKEVSDILKDSAIIAGHNLLGFDKDILQDALKEAGENIDIASKELYDTLKESRRMLDDRKNKHGLEFIRQDLEKIGKSYSSEAHNAAADVAVTADLMRVLAGTSADLSSTMNKVSEALISMSEKVSRSGDSLYNSTTAAVGALEGMKYNINSASDDLVKAGSSAIKSLNATIDYSDKAVLRMQDLSKARSSIQSAIFESQPVYPIHGDPTKGESLRYRQLVTKGFDESKNANLVKSLESLSTSLSKLQNNIVRSLEQGLRNGWKILEGPQGEKFNLAEGNREWELTVVNVDKLRQVLSKSNISLGPGATPAQAINEYKSLFKAEELSRATDDKAVAKELSTWLSRVTTDQLSKFSDTTKNLSGLVKTGKLSSDDLSTNKSLRDIYQATVLESKAIEALRSNFFKSISVPVATVSSQGTMGFETKYGSERSLAKFATITTGMEKLASEFKELGGNKDVYYGFLERLSKLPLRIDKSKEPELYKEYSSLAEDIFKNVKQLGGKEVISKGLQDAINIRLEERGVSTKPYLFETSNSLEELEQKATELGVTALDVAKAMDSIQFENFYDILDRLYQSGKTPFITKKAISLSGSEAERSSRQIAEIKDNLLGIMPLVEPGRPKRRAYDEDVVKILTRQIVSSGSLSKNLRPEEQKKHIVDVALTWQEIADNLKKLGLEEIPIAKPIDLSDASSSQLAEFNDNSTAVLKDLNKIMVSSSTSDIRALAPFEKFSSISRQMSYAANAMAGALPKGGLELPSIVSEKERTMIESGRYGTGGYGLNVLTELRNTAGTFEDQIIISGRLAEAFTRIVKPLVGPAASIVQDIKPIEKGKMVAASGRGGRLATQQYKGADPKAFEKMVQEVTNQYQEVLGVPKTYAGRADIAKISDDIKNVMRVHRGESIEVQTAELTEIFLNYFGRKLSTRFGTKGVSITPPKIPTEIKELQDVATAMSAGLGAKVKPGAGLGFATRSKSTGSLLSEMIETKLNDSSIDFTKSGLNALDLRSLADQLEKSGNKFIIDLFNDASYGIVTKEEATKQKELLNRSMDAYVKLFEEPLQLGSKGIEQIQEKYIDLVKKPVHTLEPIEARISARGIAKRGLMPEVLEGMVNNLIGTTAESTTIKNADLTMNEAVRKKINDYMWSLDFKGLNPEEQAGVEKRLRAEMGSKATDESIQRLMDFEKQWNMYTDVIDEYGNKLQSFVAPKFLQIVEEPNLYKEWNPRDIEKGLRGEKLNFQAYAAYAGVFGEGSRMLEELSNATSLSSREGWELIRAMQLLDPSMQQLTKTMINSLEAVKLSNVIPFDDRTATIEELKGTIFDISKYPAPFKLDIPSVNRKGEVSGYEPMYVPGPSVRSTYSEEIMGGRIAPTNVARYLSNLVNAAQRVEDILDVSRKGVAGLDETTAKKFGQSVRTELEKKLIDTYDQFKDIESKQVLTPANVDFMTKYVNDLKKVLSDTTRISPIYMTPSARKERRTLNIGPQTELEAVNTYESELRARGDKNLYSKLLGRMMDIIIGPNPASLKEEKNQIEMARKQYSETGIIPSDFVDKFEGQKQNYQNDFVKMLDAHQKRIEDRLAVKSKFDIELEAGNLQAFTESVGLNLNITVKDSLERALDSLSRAKVSYYEELSKNVIGPKHAIEQTFFQRVIPSSVTAKAVTAITDKTDELNKAYAQLLSSGADDTVLSSLKNIIDEHTTKILKAKQLGLPVLKEGEIGISPEMAEKIKIKQAGRDIDLNKMISENLEEAYVSTVRYPFTGTLSVQAHKAKLMESGLSRHSLAVPGAPELDMASMMSDVLSPLNKRIDEMIGAREKAWSTGDADKAKKLTDELLILMKTVRDLTPKFTNMEQKLDFDGDALFLHTGQVEESRKEIADHFNAMGNDLTSARSLFNTVFSAIDETNTKSLAEMAYVFSKKHPGEKGFNFLEKPYIEKDVANLDMAEVFKALSSYEKVDFENTESLNKYIKGALEQEFLPEVFRKAGGTVEQQKEFTSKAVASFSGGGMGIPLGPDVGEFEKTANKLLEEMVRRKLWEQKYSDAIVGQLYKLHTGQTVEGISRVARLSELETGFGTGLAGTGRTAFKPTEEFLAKWPGESAVLGEKPVEEFAARMNEILRFVIQKGLDEKHAGVEAVGKHIINKVGTRGGAAAIMKVMEEESKQFDELWAFNDEIIKSAKIRLGALSLDELRQEVKRFEPGIPTEELSSLSRQDIIGTPKFGVEYKREEAGRIIPHIDIQAVFEELFRMIKRQAIQGYIKETKTELAEAPLSTRIKKEADIARSGGFEKYAEAEMERSLNERGISILKYVTTNLEPLYKMRTSMESIHTASARSYIEPNISDLMFSEQTTNAKQLRDTYEKSLKSAHTLSRSMQSVMTGAQGGAHSLMVLTSVQQRLDDLNKVLTQAETLGIPTSAGAPIPTTKMGYAAGAYETQSPKLFADIWQRADMANAIVGAPEDVGPIEEMQHQMDRFGKMRKQTKNELETLSQILGIPMMGTEEEQLAFFKFNEANKEVLPSIDFRAKMLTETLTAKYPEKIDTAKADEIKKTTEKYVRFLEDLLRFQIAMAEQSRRVSEAIKTVPFQKTYLESAFPGLVEASGRSPIDVANEMSTKRIEDQRVSDQLLVQERENRKDLILEQLNKQRSSDMQSMVDTIATETSQTVPRRKAIEDMNRTTLTDDEINSIRAALKSLEQLAAGLPVKGEEVNLHKVYRASGLAAGGGYGKSGYGTINQPTSILRNMLGLSDENMLMEATGLRGTALHRRKQMSLADKYKQFGGFDVEGVIRYVEDNQELMTGHFDVIYKESQDAEKRLADIKTVYSSKTFDALEQLSENIKTSKTTLSSALDELSKSQSTVDKAVYSKLKGYISQINFYLESNRDAIGEIILINSEDPIKEVKLETGKFNPDLFAKDISAVKKSRDTVIKLLEALSKGGSTAEIQSILKEYSGVYEELVSKFGDITFGKVTSALPTRPTFESMQKSRFSTYEDFSSSLSAENQELFEQLSGDYVHAYESLRRGGRDKEVYTKLKTSNLPSTKSSIRMPTTKDLTLYTDEQAFEMIDSDVEKVNDVVKFAKETKERTKKLLSRIKENVTREDIRKLLQLYHVLSESIEALPEINIDIDEVFKTYDDVREAFEEGQRIKKNIDVIRGTKTHKQLTEGPRWESQGIGGAGGGTIPPIGGSAGGFGGGGMPPGGGGAPPGGGGPGGPKDEDEIERFRKRIESIIGKLKQGLNLNPEEWNKLMSLYIEAINKAEADLLGEFRDRYEKLLSEIKDAVDPSFEGGFESFKSMAQSINKAKQIRDKLKSSTENMKNEYDSIDIVTGPEAETAKGMHTNLKSLFEVAKFRHGLFGGYEAKDLGGSQEIADMLKEVSEKGTSKDLASRIKQAVDSLPEDKKGSMTAIWQYYRKAVGEYFIKELDRLRYEIDNAKSDTEGKEAFGQYRQTIKSYRDTILTNLGKSSDIYTEKVFGGTRGSVYPQLAQLTGTYRTPEEIMEIVRERNKLSGEYEPILNMLIGAVDADAIEGMVSPIEKVRKAFDSLTAGAANIKSQLLDNDLFKRFGDTLVNEWDFSKTIDGITQLRAGLESWNRLQISGNAVLGADPAYTEAQRVNIMETIKLLKQMEKAFIPSGGSAASEMGLMGVPGFLDIADQGALHKRNIAATREFFSKTPEEGGPERGRAFTYKYKIVDPSTKQVIQNAAEEFKSLGTVMDSTGEKMGRFTQRSEDLVKSFQDRQGFGQAFGRVIRWGTASSVVWGTVSALKAMVDTITDVELGIATLKQVMSPLESDFNQITTAALDFAKEFGQPIEKVIASMKVFAQQGLSQREVIDRTRTSSLAANVTTLSASDATEALTSAMKVYGREGQSTLSFLDAWSEVEALHAVTSADLANAMKKAAAAAKTSGVSFDQLNALVTGIGETSRMPGKEIGTSLRFMFRRLQTEEAPKQLAGFGIPVIGEQGDLRSAYDILGDLAGKWDELTMAQRLSIAQSVGGVRHYNDLIVLMDHWNDVVDTLADSINSKGAAERRNEIIMDTYAKKLEQVRAAMSALQVEFGKLALPVAKGILTGVKTVLETIANIPTGIKVALLALGSLFALLGKGDSLLQGFADRFSGIGNYLSEFFSTATKEFKIGIFETFGKLPKGLSDINIEGLKTITSATDITDLESFIGKGSYLISKFGRHWNESMSDMAYNGAAFSDIMRGVFGGAANVVSTFTPRIAAKSGPFAELVAILGTGLTAGFKGSSAVMEQLSKLLGIPAEKLAEWSDANTGFVASVLPMVASLTGLIPLTGVIIDKFNKLTLSSLDYEKSTSGLSMKINSELAGLRGLSKSYADLEISMSEINDTMNPEKAQRALDRGEYKGPIIETAKHFEKSINLGNKMAAINYTMVDSFDAFGNAVLKSTSDFKEFLKVMESTKIQELAELQIGVMGNYINDLTRRDGSETFKYELKRLVKEIPAVGPILGNKIQVSAAKELDVATERVNKILQASKKYPLSFGFDAMFKKYNAELDTVRSKYDEVYDSFKRVLSSIDTKGLTSSQIKRLFDRPEFREGYELIVKLDPQLKAERFYDELGKLKSSIDWKDILGIEILRRLNPETNFGFTSKITKEMMQQADVAKRTGEAFAGDVVLFTDDLDKSLNVSGKQGVLKFKDSVGWMVQYVDKELRSVKEVPYSSVVQFIDSVFPVHAMADRLDDNLELLEEHITGASAGMVGITSKEFKRNFSLGERFYGQIPTTTLLQTNKGYNPMTNTFGEQAYKKEYPELIKKYFFDPMEQLKMMLEGPKERGEAGFGVSKGVAEDLNELQTQLQNNQVILQYSAVVEDLHKTLSAGVVTLNENIVAEKTRRDLLVQTSGLLKGFAENIADINTGVRDVNQLTPQQFAMHGEQYLPSGEQTVTNLRNQIEENKLRRESLAEQAVAIKKAMVHIETIREQAAGFGVIMSPDKLMSITRNITAAGGDKLAGLQLDQMEQININTGDTASKMDDLLIALKSPGAPDAAANKVGKIVKSVATQTISESTGKSNLTDIIGDINKLFRMRESYSDRPDITGVVDKGINKSIKLMESKYDPEEILKALRYQEIPKGVLDAYINPEPTFSPTDYVSRTLGNVDFNVLLQAIERSVSADKRKWSDQDVVESSMLVPSQYPIPAYVPKSPYSKLTSSSEYKDSIEAIKKQSNISVTASKNLMGVFAGYSYFQDIMRGAARREERYYDVQIRDRRNKQVELKTRYERGEVPEEEYKTELLSISSAIGELQKQKSAAGKTAEERAMRETIGVLATASTGFAKAVGVDEGVLKLIGGSSIGTLAAAEMWASLNDEELPEVIKNASEKLKEYAKVVGKAGVGLVDKVLMGIGKYTGYGLGTAAGGVGSALKAVEEYKKESDKKGILSEKDKEQLRKVKAETDRLTPEDLEKAKEKIENKLSGITPESTEQLATDKQVLNVSQDQLTTLLAIEENTRNLGDEDDKKDKKYESELKDKKDKDYEKSDVLYRTSLRNAVDAVKGDRLLKQNPVNLIKEAVAGMMVVAGARYTGELAAFNQELSMTEEKAAKANSMATALIDRFPNEIGSIIRELLIEREEQSKAVGGAGAGTPQESVFLNEPDYFDKFMTLLRERIPEEELKSVGFFDNIDKDQLHLAEVSGNIEKQLYAFNASIIKAATDMITDLKYSITRVGQLKGQPKFDELDMGKTMAELSPTERLMKLGGPGWENMYKSYKILDAYYKGLTDLIKTNNENIRTANQALAFEKAELDPLVSKQESNLKGLQDSYRYVYDNADFFNKRDMLKPIQPIPEVSAFSPIPELDTLRQEIEASQAYKENRKRDAETIRVATDSLTKSAGDLAMKEDQAAKTTLMLSESTSILNEKAQALNDPLNTLANAFSNGLHISQFIGELEKLEERLTINTRMAELNTDAFDKMMGGSHPLARQKPTYEMLVGAAAFGEPISNAFFADKYGKARYERMYSGTPTTAEDLGKELVQRGLDDFDRLQTKANQDFTAQYSSYRQLLEQAITIQEGARRRGGLDPLVNALEEPIQSLKQRLVEAAEITVTPEGKYAYKGFGDEATRLKTDLSGWLEKFKIDPNTFNKVSQDILAGSDNTVSAIAALTEIAHGDMQSILAALNGYESEKSSTIDFAKYQQRYKDEQRKRSQEELANAANALGEIVQPKKYGGRIHGPGGPTSDSIFMKASDGEYIVNAEKSQQIGYDTLDYINNTGKLPTAKYLESGGYIENPRTGQRWNIEDVENKGASKIRIGDKSYKITSEGLKVLDEGYVYSKDLTVSTPKDRGMRSVRQDSLVSYGMQKEELNNLFPKAYYNTDEAPAISKSEDYRVFQKGFVGGINKTDFSGMYYTPTDSIAAMAEQAKEMIPYLSLMKVDKDGDVHGRYFDEGSEKWVDIAKKNFMDFLKDDYYGPDRHNLYDAAAKSLQKLAGRHTDASNIVGYSLGPFLAAVGINTKEKLDALLSEDIKKSGYRHTMYEKELDDPVVYSPRNKNISKATGGGLRRYGTGGDIPVWVSRDEYLMSADAVKSVGVDAMNYMNAKGQVPGFADGGYVDVNKYANYFGPDNRLVTDLKIGNTTIPTGWHREDVAKYIANPDSFYGANKKFKSELLVPKDTKSSLRAYGVNDYTYEHRIDDPAIKAGEIKKVGDIVYFRDPDTGKIIMTNKTDVAEKYGYNRLISGYEDGGLLTTKGYKDVYTYFNSDDAAQPEWNSEVAKQIVKDVYRLSKDNNDDSNLYFLAMELEKVKSWKDFYNKILENESSASVFSTIKSPISDKKDGKSGYDFKKGMEAVKGRNRQQELKEIMKDTKAAGGFIGKYAEGDLVVDNEESPGLLERIKLKAYNAYKNIRGVAPTEEENIETLSVNELMHRVQRKQEDKQEFIKEIIGKQGGGIIDELDRFTSESLDKGVFTKWSDILSESADYWKDKRLGMADWIYKDDKPTTWLGKGKEMLKQTIGNVGMGLTAIPDIGLRLANAPVELLGLLEKASGAYTESTLDGTLGKDITGSVKNFYEGLKKMGISGIAGGIKQSFLDDMSTGGTGVTAGILDALMPFEAMGTIKHANRYGKVIKEVKTLNSKLPEIIPSVKGLHLDVSTVSKSIGDSKDPAAALEAWKEIIDQVRVVSDTVGGENLALKTIKGRAHFQSIMPESFATYLPFTKTVGFNSDIFKDVVSHRKVFEAGSLSGHTPPMDDSFKEAFRYTTSHELGHSYFQPMRLPKLLQTLFDMPISGKKGVLSKFSELEFQGLSPEYNKLKNVASSDYIHQAMISKYAMKNLDEFDAELFGSAFHTPSELSTLLVSNAKKEFGLPSRTNKEWLESLMGEIRPAKTSMLDLLKINKMELPLKTGNRTKPFVPKLSSLDVVQKMADDSDLAYKKANDLIDEYLSELGVNKPLTKAAITPEYSFKSADDIADYLLKNATQTGDTTLTSMGFDIGNKLKGTGSIADNMAMLKEARDIIAKRAEPFLKTDIDTWGQMRIKAQGASEAMEALVGKPGSDAAKEIVQNFLKTGELSFRNGGGLSKGFKEMLEKANGGKIPAYQEGIGYVPKDQYAYLHEGERVVPADQNRPASTQSFDAGAVADKIQEAIENAIKDTKIELNLDNMPDSIPVAVPEMPSISISNDSITRLEGILAAPIKLDNSGTSVGADTANELRSVKELLSERLTALESATVEQSTKVTDLTTKMGTIDQDMEHVKFKSEDIVSNTELTTRLDKLKSDVDVNWRTEVNILSSSLNILGTKVSDVYTKTNEQFDQINSLANRVNIL